MPAPRTVVVYLVRALPGDAFARLAATPDERFLVLGGGARPAGREEQLAAARAAEVYAPSYLDRVDRPLLDAMPLLRHVASYGIGTDHIDLDACRARGVVVTHTPGVLTETTADHAFALLLAVARRVCEADRMVRGGRWKEVDPGAMLGVDVHGKTLGLVGYGRIGQAVGRRARGFGMTVLYAGPRPPHEPRTREVDLDTLLRVSDFVSLHCPLTDATRGLLGGARLRAMKRGAILVNTARGPLVDEAALVEVLREGHLGGAGLDVYRDEPHVPQALRRLPNVVLTPHIGSGTHETRVAMTRLVVEDIMRVAEGLAPRHPVEAAPRA